MSEPGRPTAVVRRVLAATPEVAYDQWLDAEALAEFITPHPARSGVVEVDASVGGSFRIEMIDLGSVVRISGRYVELDRPHRLRFTWQSSLGGGFDSIVTVTFEPRGEVNTLMTIEHARLPVAWRDDHARGWTKIGHQLDTSLRRLATGT